MASTATDVIDGVSSSVSIKAPVRVATTANITLSGFQTIDDVALAAGDENLRVLVKNQTSAVDNGIWIASTSAWSRAADFDGNRDVVKGTTVLVNSGTANGNKAFSVLTNDPIVIGTSSITFQQTPTIGGDASSVSYTPPGGSATNVDDYLDATEIAVPDSFGTVDRTGVANSTAALLAFFSHCISTGVRGHISKGTYLVTAGQLSFSAAFTDKAFPIITTDGHEAVTFLRADATDAAMIMLTNGTASSGSFAGWRGGYIGGITFDQNSQVTASSQHGLSLTGCWGVNFGHMRGDDLGGSCIYIPQNLYGGSNPDPYNVAFCHFDAMEANRCVRYGFENQNWLGFTGNRVEFFRCIQCEAGGWYGFGTANEIGMYSIASVGGWAFDDGCQTANTGGTPLRFSAAMGEIDNPENGVRLNRCRDIDFSMMRINHRYQFDTNPGAFYWPLKAIEVGNGSLSTDVRDVKIHVVHRIEAGGVKGDLGSLYDGSSDANILGMEVSTTIQDNASFGFVDSDYHTGINATSTTLITKNTNIPVADTRIKVGCYVRSATSVSLPTSGYGTLAGLLAFATELSDRGSYYSSADSWFVAPYTGLYRVDATICVACAVGTEVRIGFVKDAGSVTLLKGHIGYQADTGNQHYSVSGIVSLTAGDKLYLTGDNDSGGAVAFTAPTSTTADLTWSVVVI